MRALQAAGTKETDTYPQLRASLAQARAIPAGELTGMIEELDRIRGQMLAFLDGFTPSCHGSTRYPQSPTAPPRSGSIRAMLHRTVQRRRVARGGGPGWDLAGGATHWGSGGGAALARGC